MIRPAELIERKRDGGQLSAEEWNELMLGYARDDVPDYQLAALAMAVFFRGLTPEETYDLTNAMIATGDTVDLHSALGRKVVDKHSTGGVGDKTSIAVGPIVAACGVPFAKMSGRGLGHTGGTLDKLESIPGFRVELSIDEFVDQVRDAGMAIIGASANLVPADKKLYALRDVTATVDNYSLIAASIMSKKIAGGADAIVIDAKVGDGAFMKSTDDARALAEAMLDLGARSGREVVCLLTDMDQPLGRAVGNALEIREAIATVKGEGPPDFLELVLAATSRLLAVSDLGIDEQEGRIRAMQAIADGSAFEAYERWIRAQGGDPSEDALAAAPVVQQRCRSAFGLRLRARRGRRRPGGAPSRSWTPDEGRLDRPRGRDRAPPQARRPRGRGRSARGDPCRHRHGRRRSGAASCSPRTRSRTTRRPSGR